MRPSLAVIVRLMAFVGKEIIETLRRPGAILSLILGPFLIMAIFGVGYSGVRRPLDTVLVIPPDSGLSQDIGSYQNLAGAGFTEIAFADCHDVVRGGVRYPLFLATCVRGDTPRGS